MTLKIAENYGRAFRGLGAKSVEFFENPSYKDFTNIFDYYIVPFRTNKKNEDKRKVLLFAYVGHG